MPLNWDSVNTSAGIYGAGVLAHMRPVDYPGPRIWHLTSHSYLDQKGVQWSPAMVDPPIWLIHAHADFSPWSWEFFNLPQYISNVSFPFVQIGVVIGIFVFCAGVDLARKYTIGKLETCQLLNLFCECVEKKVLIVIKNISLR